MSKSQHAIISRKRSFSVMAFGIAASAAQWKSAVKTSCCHCVFGFTGAAANLPSELNINWFSDMKYPFDFKFIVVVEVDEFMLNFRVQPGTWQTHFTHPSTSSLLKCSYT